MMHTRLSDIVTTNIRL